ncbi:MAG: cytochrome c oxidase assembly protein subunit 11 [Gammaproteobacteria bacterium]|jgi:cytochrome c oxidase assembly protein subunit 11
MGNSVDAANKRLGYKLLVVTLVMFGFGYALVPIYNVFCDITGLNGKTGRISAETAASETVDQSRSITVEFVTSTGSSLPWKFKAKVAKMSVHPGAATEAVFVAENQAQFPVVGRAVPSVAPNSAARYFNKTECFCFTEQKLAAGETKDMVVRFVVDPRLPAHIRTLTLAYTFFETPELTAND